MTTTWSPRASNFPQIEAYESEADILFYGGKPAGGKTDLILGLAKNKHKNALLLRRSYNEIKRGFMPRSKEFYGDADKYFNATNLVWNLPGQRIEFGYGERDDDYKRYKGPNFDLIGIDEASETARFEDGTTPIDMLLPWNRTPIPGQRVRMVITSNPGGPGEEWLIEYFGPWLDADHPNPAKPGELRWFIRNRNGVIEDVQKGTKNATSRTFIASSWKDNPDFKNEEYEKKLFLLPEPLRSQLRLGLFGVGASDDRWQVIPSQWVRDAQDRWKDREFVAFDRGGVDVARGGKDKTTFVGKVDNWFSEIKKIKGSETPTGQIAASYLIDFLKGKGTPNIGMDITGIGASCYDYAVDLDNMAISPFVAGGSAPGTDKSGYLGFKNLRAKVYWMFREALDPDSDYEIELPPDQELLADLCAQRWKQSGTDIQLIEKRAITKIIGRSPDSSDSVVICWHEGNSLSIKDFYPEDTRKPIMVDAMTEQY